ncbi:recombination protein RecR [candidate division KSB1 bacterium]|nr:MAG: recombination protein RecR [candidate division KSB1 bacterium]
MSNNSNVVDNLISKLSKLPGIGRKTAQRLSFYLLKLPREEVIGLARALVDIKDKIKYCKVCFNISEGELCKFCRSEKRDKSVICVVEEPNDIYFIEKTNEYRGLYHVLGGVLSPLNGIGVEDLKIKELIKRLDEKVKEVIIAINPSVEGEATILYLSKIIKPLGKKVTRLARGIPVGGDLEYTDEVTVSKALEGRIDV